MNQSSSSNAHSISLETAVEMTTRYRAQKEAILAPDAQGRNLLSISETFDRAAFDSLLAQPGCTALRIYYGMDETLQLHAIVIGVNASNEDILPAGGGTPGEIVEISKLCPPICAPASPLNS